MRTDAVTFLHTEKRQPAVERTERSTNRKVKRSETEPRADGKAPTDSLGKTHNHSENG